MIPLLILINVLLLLSFNIIGIMLLIDLKKLQKQLPPKIKPNIDNSIFEQIQQLGREKIQS